MGAIYVDRELIDMYRFFGLTVNEVAGWERRSRASGGFPTKVEVLWGHHTASGPASDGWPTVNYGTFGAPAKPIANEYHDRQGVIWFSAGGATNTEGAGGPWHHISKDMANAVSWSMEVMNNGVGEPYTDAQEHTLLMANIVFSLYCIKRGWWTLEELRNNRLGTHFEWAPTRKIDLRGPSRWTGGANVKWNYNQFREDVYQGVKYLLTPAQPEPEPLPPEPEPIPGGSLPWAPITEPERVWVPDPMAQREQGQRVVEVQFCLSVLQGPLPGGCDGDYGPTTADHVRWWQGSHGLPVTGEVDIQTARSLGFNAVPQPPPPPVVPIPAPPAASDVWIEPNPFFMIHAGARWAYTVAQHVWGNGNLYPHLEAANPTWPAIGQHIRVPNGAGLPVVVGGAATVRPGDGPYSILRRLWPNDDPNMRLSNFYKWNGGTNRALQPGEKVFIPV